MLMLRRCLMMLCAIPTLTTPSAFAAEPPAYVKNESSVDLRSFGLAFHAPPGWGREPELRYSQLARFAKISDKKIVGLFEAQGVPAKGRTAQEIAASVASDLKGQVVDKGTVPSEPPGTIEVTLAPTDHFPVGRAAVFPVRDQIVIVQVAAASAAELTSAFATVMGSMVIKAPIPADQDLAVDRKRPIALFDSAVLLQLPEPFRPDKVKDETKQMFLGAHDFTTNHDDASLQIQLLPNPEDKPLKDLCQAMAGQLSAKLKTMITFTPANNAPVAFISNAFPPAGKDVQRIVQMRVDDHRLAVLIFRSSAADPKVRDHYMAAAEAIAKAARISEAYRAAREANTPPPTK